jgi:phosphatidylserine/phosphatidylglycerophosphate/cardiolipin synthase-like enzyme
MALKHFTIEIKQHRTTPIKEIKEVDVKFLNSQVPIPGQELFAESQELAEAIEKANKKGVKVNIIIGDLKKDSAVVYKTGNLQKFRSITEGIK